MYVSIRYSEKNPNPTAIKAQFTIPNHLKMNGVIKQSVCIIGAKGERKSIELSDDQIAVIIVQRGQCKIKVMTHDEYNAKQRDA